MEDKKNLKTSKLLFKTQTCPFVITSTVFKNF